MGTPAFAAVVLEKLARWPGGSVIAVYTQPDRPRGRGMRLAPSPVKELARSMGLDVRQPLNFKREEERKELAELRPDILVAAAYGLILPKAVLDAARIAPLNVHASLLPRYRGAAPIQRAIMENWGPDAVTGVSIMRMEPSLDTGPVYAARAVPVAGMTAGALAEVLAMTGGDLLVESLPGIVAGTLPAKPQDHAAATHAAKLTREDGLIDWARPAARVDAQVRGVTPAPGATTRFLCKDASEPLDVRVMAGHVGPTPPGGPLPEPGALVRLSGPRGEELAVACADGLYVLDRLRPSGRKDMTGAAFANGYAPRRALTPGEAASPESPA